MKRCPECRRDYYDNSLHYCLDDGAALLEGPASMDEPGTELFAETPTAILPETRPKAGGETSGRPLDKRLILAPVVLAIILAGFVGFQYFSPGGEQIESITVMPFANKTGNGELDYLSECRSNETCRFAVDPI